MKTRHDVAGTVHGDADEGLAGFLIDRLTEDLARVWVRDACADQTQSRPGMAAQVEVLDELLGTLYDGRLPARGELRVLLHGYALHPQFDHRWNRLVAGDPESTS